MTDEEARKIIVESLTLADLTWLDSTYRESLIEVLTRKLRPWVRKPSDTRSR